MKYASEMSSAGMLHTHIASCIKTGSGIRTLIRGHTDTQSRQHADLISLLFVTEAKR
jgi:hypothetical protein